MDAPPRYELLAMHGSDEIGRWALAPGVYTVGRSRDCSIALEADGLHDEHARLSIDGDGSISLEVGAAGACVDGSSITGAVRVMPEQYIDLGSISLLLQTGAERTVSLGDAPQEEDEVPAEFRRPERYEAGQQIAKGGMGAILNVRQSAIRRSVAMKVILDRAEEDPRQRLRFIEEAQITGQLEHPNIVPVHDAGIDADRRIFYTMKLVKGITLKKVLQLLKEREPGIIAKYPLPTLLTVFVKVCDALAFAHSRGVIHRDIKPENIMIGSYGEVLLMDWGLAKLIGAAGPSLPRHGDTVLSARAEAADSFATMQGSVMGTPNYMSPQQARGEVEQLDARSDIFSLGIVLHELLTLERPFTGKTAKALLERIASGEPADPAPLRRPRKPGELPHLPQGVPDSLAAVVLKALAPRPADRYQAVKELQADLAAYQNGFATGAERAGSWKLVKLFVRRNKVATAAAALILLVVAGFGTNLVVDRKHILAQRAIAQREANRANHEAKHANEALSELRKTAPTLRQLAENEAKQGAFASALEKLDAAIALTPEYLPSYWRRAWLLMGQELFLDAATALRLALQKDPVNRQLAAILPVVEQFAALPAGQPWPVEGAGQLYRHLVTVGAEGEVATLSSKLGATVDANLKVVKARMAVWLGKGYNGSTVGKTPDGLISVGFVYDQIKDLEPLRGLPINYLSLPRGSDAPFLNLEPLRGMRLFKIDFGSCSAPDYSPLAGMPLREFYMAGGRKQAPNFSPLRGLPLEQLDVFANSNIDLSPFRGAPLRRVVASSSDLSFLADSPIESLDNRGGQVLDLSPLRAKPLKMLDLSSNHRLADLSPLRGLPIEDLRIQVCKKLTDLAILLELPKLQRLCVSSDMTKLLLPLRKHPSLAFISITNFSIDKLGYQSVAEFWAEYDAQKAAKEK